MALLTLAGSLSVGGVWACSSDGQRDQNYGKDVATTYIRPEAGIRDLAAPRDTAAVDTPDAGTDTSGDTTMGDTGEDGGSDATSDGAADR